MEIALKPCPDSMQLGVTSEGNVSKHINSQREEKQTSGVQEERHLLSKHNQLDRENRPMCTMG